MSDVNLDEYVAQRDETMISGMDINSLIENGQKIAKSKIQLEVEKQKQLLELQKEYERDQIQWQAEQANADLQPKLDLCNKQLEQEKKWSGYLNEDIQYYQSESMKIKADFETLKRVTAASILLSLILAGVLVYKTVKLKSKKVGIKEEKKAKKHDIFKRH